MNFRERNYDVLVNEYIQKIKMKRTILTTITLVMMISMTTFANPSSNAGESVNAYGNVYELKQSVYQGKSILLTQTVSAAGEEATDEIKEETQPEEETKKSKGFNLEGLMQTIAGAIGIIVTIVLVGGFVLFTRR